MAIPKFEDDLNIIAALGNNPGADNGLTPEEFKAKFDEGVLLIQAFINEVLIPEMDATVDVQALLNKILDPYFESKDKAAQAKAVGDALQKLLPLKGGTMTGPLNVKDPTEDSNAANKKYVDTNIADTYLTTQAKLFAAGWAGDGPYTQTVAVEGVLASDRVHYGVVYSGDKDTMVAQKEAFSLVDDLDSAEGSVTFTCFEEKPGMDLTIMLEVNR